MTRHRYSYRIGLLVGACLWLGCNERGCAMFTKKSDEARPHPTRAVVLDEPLVNGIAPFRTDEDGSGDRAVAGIRELTTTGTAEELVFAIYDSDSAGACGRSEGVLFCESIIDATMGDIVTGGSLLVDDPRIVSLTLAERQLTVISDGGPPQERITTATSESAAGTLAIRRVVGGEDGIEDDGVDLDLDLTFHMSDGRDRHIVMTVSWRFQFECLKS